MGRLAHSQVVGLAALLSVISLALVFGAALRVAPPTVLPRAPDPLVGAIPHVNAAISVLALVAIGNGWRWIRRGEIRKHRRAMLAGVVLFAVFLGLYLYKVALTGPTPFPGEGIARTVYLAVLAIHILLAIVCVPLLYYVLLLAVTRSVAAIPDTLHPRVGRIAAALWLLSFALGLVVYLLLYVV